MGAIGPARCVAVSPLGDPQVTAELAQTPGWKRAGKAIERTYRFPDFNAAMVFVNWVAALAERANHHPDMTIRYNEVTVSVWTHSEGGLTSKDFALARGIDAL
ncbi:MAG: 4a-hydroxytetrahydrobiopterin dehydratase [Candidatus Rokuibacteriota bacterium]|nr:MAG: 4a-hydroxytetrahydrobiopterin dehydratase [Candidatus Rokubacteria bacterium]